VEVKNKDYICDQYRCKHYLICSVGGQFTVKRLPKCCKATTQALKGALYVSIQKDSISVGFKNYSTIYIRHTTISNNEQLVLGYNVIGNRTEFDGISVSRK